MSHSQSYTEQELDRIADSIARAKGAGPLHLMPESSAGQYRAMARAATSTAARCLSERMRDFPLEGRHTRASWAVVMLRTWGARPIEGSDL